jgi:hypothetical protein
MPRFEESKESGDGQLAVTLENFSAYTIQVRQALNQIQLSVRRSPHLLVEPVMSSLYIVEGINACQTAGCSIGRAWQPGKEKAQRHDVWEACLLFICVCSCCLVDAKRQFLCP